MSQVEIRRCTDDDHDQVKSLVVAIMNEEFHQDAQAYPTEDLDHVTNTYGGIGEAFFVAMDGDKVIGTVGIKKEDDRIALLRRLFVNPDYRSQGIGIKLIDRALDFCRELGYEEIIFRTTSRMTRAIGVCERYGFVQRAKVDLGPIELFKFVLALNHA